MEARDIHVFNIGMASGMGFITALTGDWPFTLIFAAVACVSWLCAKRTRPI